MMAACVIYVLLLFHFILYIKAGDESPTHFLNLDWDKFDHLYDLGHDESFSSIVPISSNHVYSKATVKALPIKIEEKAITQRIKRPYTKRLGSKEDYNKIRGSKAREVVRMKLANMSEEERIAYKANLTQKRLERERRMREKTGYRTPTQYKYHALKRLVDGNQANLAQEKEFHRMKEQSRRSSARVNQRRKDGKDKLS